MLRTDAAEHEAAHVVVGLALGLKLKRAAIVDNGTDHGFSWFLGRQKSDRLALGVMYCAGPAWEAARRGCAGYGRVDLKLARQWLKLGRNDVRAAIRIAGELLANRRALHVRIASELCDRDLTARDVEAMVLE